jgi:hypothetical protein
MPTYLRRFYYQELIKSKEEENKKIKKSQSKSQKRFNPNSKFKR